MIVSLVALVGGKAQSAHSAGLSPTALLRAFNCIHRYEGDWNANTGNNYYGGLQMDMNFQQTYGADYLRAWGTANLWPPMVQIAVAIRAYLSGRGFNPWPVSSRLCGVA